MQTSEDQTIRQHAFNWIRVDPLMCIFQPKFQSLTVQIFSQESPNRHWSWFISWCCICEQHTASSLHVLLGSKGSVAYFFKKETAQHLAFIKKKKRLLVYLWGDDSYNGIPVKLNLQTPLYNSCSASLCWIISIPYKHHRATGSRT